MIYSTRDAKSFIYQIQSKLAVFSFEVFEIILLDKFPPSIEQPVLIDFHEPWSEYAILFPLSSDILIQVLVLHPLCFADLLRDNCVFNVLSAQLYKIDVIHFELAILLTAVACLFVEDLLHEMKLFSFQVHPELSIECAMQ